MEISYPLLKRRNTREVKLSKWLNLMIKLAKKLYLKHKNEFKILLNIAIIY